jgi:hypothetical protein
MHVSGTLDSQALECLNLRKALKNGVGSFTSIQDIYLAYHRNNIFLE